MHKPDPADRHALHVVPGLLPESRISPPLKRVSVPVPSRRAASPFNMRSRGSHTTPVREMLPLYEPWCLGQVIGRVIVGRARVAPVQSIKKNSYYFWGGTNLIIYARIGSWRTVPSDFCYCSPRTCWYISWFFVWKVIDVWYIYVYLDCYFIENGKWSDRTCMVSIFRYRNQLCFFQMEERLF